MTIRNVRQSDGTDLDPGNTKIAERAPAGDSGASSRRFRPIELGAVVNTVCSRCGGKGHTKYECFANAEKVMLKDGLDPAANAGKYDFVDSSDDDETYFKAFQKPDSVKDTAGDDKEMTVKRAFEILRKEEKRKNKKKEKRKHKKHKDHKEHKERKERKDVKDDKKYKKHKRHSSPSSSSSSSRSGSSSYSSYSSSPSYSSYSSSYSGRSRSASPSHK